MNIFICGWNVNKAVAEAAFGELTAMSKIFPQLDPETMWFQTTPEGILAGSIHTPEVALGAKRYVYHRIDGVTFFDGVIANPTDCDASAEKASTVEALWENLTALHEGNFVAVRVDSNKGTLEIKNDPSGLQQVYFQRIGQMWLVSNHVGLLSKITGANQFDKLGIDSMIIIGWPVGDRTLLANIGVMPGAQIWRWIPGEKNPNRHTYFSLSQLKTEQRHLKPREQVASTLKVMGEFCRAVANQAQVVRCGLTGGRDSRLLALICHKNRMPVQYVTYGPENSIDVRIAKHVARTLGLVHKIDSSPGQRLEELWDHLVGPFIEQNDGMVSLYQFQVMVNRQSEIYQLQHVMHGNADARGLYVEPWLFAKQLNVHKMKLYMTRKFLSVPGASLTLSSAHQEIKNYLEKFVNKVVENGFLPLDVPDIFYLDQRARRWAGTVVRPSLPIADVFQPFMLRQFFRTIIEMSTYERWRQQFHNISFELLAPKDLKDVPFDSDCSLLGITIRGMKRAAMRSRVASSFGKRHFLQRPQFHILEAVLPQVREICLDQNKSILWESVNRSTFERVVSENTPASKRALHIETIYRIITLFYLQEKLN